MGLSTLYDRQHEVFELYKQLAEKYKVTPVQVMQVIDLKMECVREQLKKSNPWQDKAISVRLYKFAVFYIPKGALNILQRKLQNKLNREQQWQNQEKQSNS